MTEYLNENKKLANDFLERTYFQHYRKGARKIEFFMTGICSANCEYCYLKKHQSDLYPTELHNSEIILNNLTKLMNWYVEQEFCCDIDLFSANWVNTPIGEKIFDIIYNALVKTERRPRMISIPDNMQFLKDEKATNMVEKNIERFWKIGVHLSFSASVDGYHCEDGRTPVTDEFYQKLKDFLLVYGYHLHPMISSYNIDRQIQNHQWWVENFPHDLIKNLMTLEVREDTWTEEKIQMLIQYCDYLIDTKLQDYNGNLIELIDYIFYFNKNNNAPYNILGIRMENALCGDSTIACSCSNNSLSIRLGDLMVAPCHRLFYPELLFGHFDSNDTTILDFIPENTSWLIASKTINKRSMPYCEDCEFEPICIGFCQGASFESYGNPWVPPKEVCEMYKAKYSFIIYKLYTLGLYSPEPLMHIEQLLSPTSFKYFMFISQLVLDKFNIKLAEEI